MYAVRVGEGYLYARASAHSLPPLGGSKLPFARGKCGNNSSIIFRGVVSVSFVDREGCNALICGRERPIADSYNVFILLFRLLACQNPGGNTRCLFFSLVFAPPPGLASQSDCSDECCTGGSYCAYPGRPVLEGYSGACMGV